ncbi:MAG: sulfide/dihydroorotate dehydrogenase-like FAD/NAD-binding protein [bacterium]|nr:sulfide/dihydroorotate dehydrogenase-like FAD/NAD-binding protein [bacterium]
MGYKIISKKELCPNQYEIQIEAPYVVKNAKAGQFIIFRAEENGERVPLTIADVDKANGILTIVYMAVGYSTKKLAALEVGDEIPDIVGPLGVPTHVSKLGTVICVAGGYGAAPCYLIAKAFKEVGNKVYMVMGARNEKLIFWEDKMKDACDELFITTDDGTKGRQGFVTGVVEEIINREKTDLVIAVGPMPMMRAVCNLTKEPNIKTIVSMNPIMVDGTGMCGACRLTVGGETKFACVDGPDFDGHLVDFDEVIARTSIYKPQEKQRNENCNLLKAGK